MTATNRTCFVSNPSTATSTPPPTEPAAPPPAAAVEPAPVAEPAIEPVVEAVSAYSITVPAYRARLRLIALVYGAVLLIWSSLEDNSVLPAALLGGGLAVIILLLWITRRWGGRTLAGRAALAAASAVGALTGVSAALATAALMLIKDGLHAHLFPDYPFGMILDVLARAPLWALAGALAGIGLLLAWWAIGRSRTA